MKDINPNINGITFYSTPVNFVEFNSQIYFRADNGVDGFEMWKSDGTNAGTIMIQNIYPTGTSVSDVHFVDAIGTIAGQYLFFTANDSVHGYQLYKINSMGVPSIVKDFDPSTTQGGIYTYGVELNGKMYFAASDNVNGEELWETDGTEVGTKMVGMMNNTGDNYLQHLTKIGDCLYFSADDGIHGQELWKYKPTICENTLNLTGVAIDTLYRAQVSIVSSQTIQANMTHFSYRSPSVSLNYPFTVEDSARFSVAIGNCE